MAEAEAEWAPKQDMSLLCRVCANQHDYLIPIFQGEGLDHEMPTKMGKHLPIKVRATDKLPTQMCYQCASTIIAWSELHTNCLAADKKLKGMLKKDGVVEDDNAASDHYEDAFDDGGGAQDDDDEEDFEKEIKQLISDAGVELGSNKEVKRAPRVPVTRKRKAEVTITPVVKKEPKKLKTEPLPAKSSASKSTSAKSNASASKTSTALVKPKEEVVPNEERWVWYCCHCSEQFDNSSLLVSHSALHNTKDKELCDVCKMAYIVHLRNISLPNETNVKLEIVEVGEGDEDLGYDDVEELLHLPLSSNAEVKEEAEDVDVFVCSYCLVYFTAKTLLEVHITSFHRELYEYTKIYECKICGAPKVYSRKQDILKHMRNIHNDGIIDVSHSIKESSVAKTVPLRKKCMNSSYECKSCNKIYSRSQDIMKHMRNIHGKNNVNPDHYKQKVPLSLMNFPEYKDITKYIYKCEICNVTHEKPASLIEHINEVHQRTRNFNDLVAYSTQEYGCIFCNQEEFISLNELRSHYFQKHNFQPHIYLCPKCNAYFLFASNMSNHLREVHADTEWNNQDLLNTVVMIGNGKINFSSESYLDAHLQLTNAEHSTEISRKKGKYIRLHNRSNVVCSKCDQTFACKEVLGEHLNVHSSDYKPHCQNCNEIFKNLNCLWYHMFNKHPLGPHQCTSCHVILYRKGEVKKHMRVNHGIVLFFEDSMQVQNMKDDCRTYVDGVLKYKCQECSLIVGSITCLQRHLLTHSGDKPIECDQCDKQFRTNSALRSHLSIVHENIRKFRCEYCARAFSCQSNLIQHIRIHTGEKPYVCDECGNRFAQYASLYSHKLTHAQNYCHECTECGRAFHRISRLRQHMRIHTGDRPPRAYECDVCQKGFRSNSERKRHQEIHNSVRSFVCEICGSGFTVKKYLIQHYKVHRDVGVETVTVCE